MVEGSPPKKSDEQYPLLMVNGGGDAIRAQSQPQSALSSVWSVNTARAKWRERWPELLSACWMMIILLGISFLVFYVIGIIAYRTQPFLIVKCNNSIAANDIYYYEIVEHGNAIPFSLFSDFLADQAQQFSNLRFNVFFLVDDAFQSAFTIHKHAGLFSKLIPSHNFVFKENQKQELQNFQIKYPNVNITVMPLSVYMAMTPFKYKWRNIPIMTLPFYARIFSVWQNGGVGIDLMTYSSQYKKHQVIDKNLRAILRQHNDGITSDGYAKVLNEISNSHDDDFLSLVYNVLDQIMSDTRTFINKTFPTYEMTAEKNTTFVEPLVRTHRSKRDLSIQTRISSEGNDLNSTVTQTAISGKTILTSGVSNVENAVPSDKSNTNITESQTTQMNIVKMSESGPPKMMNKSVSINVNASEVPQAVFIYDLVFSSGNAGPFLFSDPISQSFMGNVAPFTAENKKKKSMPPIFLTLESEGLFVAATTRLHPFLGYIVSSGCRRMDPSFTIKDAIMTKCSNFFRDDFCNNIFVI